MYRLLLPISLVLLSTQLATAQTVETAPAYTPTSLAAEPGLPRTPAA